MNELQIFNNPEFGEVRTIVKNDEVWFVGKDVTKALKYKDNFDALKRHVDAEDKYLLKTGETPELKISNYGVTVINESGLYRFFTKKS